MIYTKHVIISSVPLSEKKEKRRSCGKEGWLYHIWSRP